MPPKLQLRKRRHFPTLDELPEENELDTSYYTMDRGGYFRPAHHWVFLAEIVTNQSFLRPHFIVRDRVGKTTQVVFYLDNDVTFDSKPYREGHTLAVFYADMHAFMDGSYGLRVEELSTVKLIPCSLETLLSADPSAADAATTCATCGKTGSLSACTLCKTKYCGKECQTKEWKAHKPKCAAIQQVRTWNGRNWNKFGHGDNHWDAF